MNEYIFVYGTLLKGEPNSFLLDECQLVDYIFLEGDLYDTENGYPSARLYKSGNRVFGELYRLPESNLNILNKLDLLESTDSGLFSRRVIEIEQKRIHFYEGSVELNRNLIENGSWLQHDSLAKRDPSQFAISFEDIQKKNYRKASEIDMADQIYLEGSVPVLVTSPHSTTHRRKGKLKRFEFYTAAIAEILHAKNSVHALYSNSLSELDPNYYDKCPFKEKMNDILRKNIRFVIDIHGTGKERKEDIYPGFGNKKRFTGNKPKIADILQDIANDHDIKTGSEYIFPARRQNTVAKYSHTRYDVPSMQLEINRKYRDPLNDRKSFENIIGFLSDFLISAWKEVK